jgi:hypothetical protein
MPCKHLGVASIAAPEVSAESLSAASLNVGDGTPMRGRHRRAMGRRVAVREAAEDVRDLDHDWSAKSEAGRQLVENASERDVGRLGQVCIDGGRANVRVAKQPRVIMRTFLCH